MIQPNLFAAKVQPLFEEHRAEWLAQARLVALQLGADGRTVTVDDVRRILPPPPGFDPRVMGAVLRTRDWVKVGYKSSDRRTCHGRPVALFKRC